MRKKKPVKRKQGFAVKKKKWNFRGFFKGAICLSVFTLFVAAGFGFYKYLITLPYFNIKEITIIGGEKVSTREIISESGLHIGENLLSTDVNDVMKSVEKHPWIKKVEVRRLLPSELEISVQERVASALIKFDDIYYIDKDGVVFQSVASGDEIRLPIITGVEMEELLEDESSASEGIFKALNFLEVLEKNNFRHIGEISEIQVDRLNGLALYTMNGAVRIDIGNGDFENRLIRLEKIAANLRNGLSGVDFIDLDYEKKGVVRYKNASGFSKI